MKNIVEFITQPNNVGICLEVQLSQDEVATLPCVTRRISRQDMYHRCLINTGNLPSNVPGLESHPKTRLSKGSFHTIASTITSGNEKLLTAVDYVTGVLEHDAVDVFQGMIENFSANTARREELTRHLEIARTS